MIKMIRLSYAVWQ